MTGMADPKVSTSDICRMTRKVSRTWSTLNSLKASAQSPPMSRKPWPWQARANCSCSDRTSPANTSGEHFSNRVTAAANSSGSSYTGICDAFFAVQDSGLHSPEACAAWASGGVAATFRLLPNACLPVLVLVNACDVAAKFNRSAASGAEEIRTIVRLRKIQISPLVHFVRSARKSNGTNLVGTAALRQKLHLAGRQETWRFSYVECYRTISDLVAAARLQLQL
eukprot:scaffold49817_cov43-Attheya_sp.AAC.2